MSSEAPNCYQRLFFRASMGRYPETEMENIFAANNCPVSPEDAAWRHITNSASYAKDVVVALQEGDQGTANRRLQDFRDEGMQTRGFGKEALSKLQGLGLIGNLYRGDIVPQTESELEESRKILERLESIPRPRFEDEQHHF